MSFKLAITENSDQSYDHWEVGAIRQQKVGGEFMVTMSLYKDKAALDAGAEPLMKSICIPEADVAAAAAFRTDMEAAIRLKDDLSCGNQSVDFTLAVDA